MLTSPQAEVLSAEDAASPSLLRGVRRAGVLGAQAGWGLQNQVRSRAGGRGQEHSASGALTADDQGQGPEGVSLPTLNS